MLICCSPYIVSQELEKPVLKFSYACASNNFNNFEVDVSFNTTVFDTNNIFTLELSDKNGSFSTPTVVKSISDKNQAFSFTTSFQVPLNTNGTGYKLRVKASSPAKISPESDVFEAYYTTSDQLILNNFTDVILCDGASKDLTLNINTAESYQWYKDGAKYFFGGPTITVTEPGLYYSEIYYGSCSSSAVSNIVEVTKLAPVDASIKGNSVIDLCPTDTYILEANVDNVNSIYSWYKDGVKIAGLPNYSPTYTISNANQFGTYSLEVENDKGCVNTSADVIIKAADSNFTITAVSSLSTYILQGTTKNLKIDHNAVNATIEWFKDGIAIPSSNSKEIQVSEIGTYIAKVSTVSASCTFEKESSEFKIFDIKEMQATSSIQNGYIACESSESTVSISEVIVIDTNNQSHTLSLTEFVDLSFQWHVNGTAITGATNKELLVNDFNNNGIYFATVSSGIISTNSNETEVNLALPPVAISSNSTGNVICAGQTIRLNTPTVTGYLYQWFKNGTSISAASTNNLDVVEFGSYTVEVTGFGCKKTSEAIVITNFDESVVQVDTELAFNLHPGETKTITASGGDTYVWTNENNTIISNTETIIIDKEGVYTLTVKVGACEVQKTLTVTETGTKEVQNLVTLNNDGIHDFWALSNRYARNPSITVEIYNSGGELVFKTNNYQNNWPNNSSSFRSQLYYYIIKKENETLKKGTISVLK